MVHHNDSYLDNLAKPEFWEQTPLFNSDYSLGVFSSVHQPVSDFKGAK